MPVMGQTHPTSPQAAPPPFRAVVQLSVAAVAAIIVVPIGTSDRSCSVAGLSIATRAAKCIVAVEMPDLDPAPECFTGHEPASVGLVRQQPLALLAAETALTESITITRIGSRHGP